MLHRPTWQAPRGVWLVVAAALALPALVQMFTGHEGLEPKGEALGWDALLVATHLLADLSTALSYIAIAAMLGYLAFKARSGLPFMWTFVAFGVFIIACGFTHAIAVATIYTPWYWLSAGTKVLTAVASVGTAAALPPLLPKVLAMVEAARLSDERGRTLITTNEELVRARDLLQAELESTTRDVSDLALELAERTREAERALELRNQFLSIASHELKTPVTMIKGYLQVLPKILPPEARKLLISSVRGGCGWHAVSG